jgi:hypothetical protein
MIRTNLSNKALMNESKKMTYLFLFLQFYLIVFAYNENN